MHSLASILKERHMICTDCNNMLQITDYVIGTHLYCENCRFEKVEHKSSGHCCTNPNYIYVRHYYDESDFHSETDNYSVWEQCSNCGSKKGKARKKGEFIKSKLSRSHELLFQEIENRKLEFVKLANSIENKKKEHRLTIKHQKYTDYINSARWKQISKEVLQRDNYICQSCLVEEAVEVHHPDYNFLGNEPLFTLFSVCKRCHEIITQIQNQGNTENTPLIKYRFDQKSF